MSTKKGKIPVLRDFGLFYEELTTAQLLADRLKRPKSATANT